MFELGPWMNGMTLDGSRNVRGEAGFEGKSGFWLFWWMIARETSSRQLYLRPGTQESLRATGPKAGLPVCSAAMAMDVTLGLEGGLVFASATSQLDSDSGNNEWNSENWGALLYHYKGVCVCVFA